MLKIEKIKKMLEDRNLSKVSRTTGVHINTLRNIRDGKNDNPSYKVVLVLSEYLEA